MMQFLIFFISSLFFPSLFTRLTRYSTRIQTPHSPGGISPVSLAVSHRNYGALRILLENDADPNEHGVQDALLHKILANKGCDECARLLIAHHKTDLNARDKVAVVIPTRTKKNQSHTPNT